MAGAAFEDVGVSVFDVAVSLLVAGATFGDVAVSLFVAGATFGDVGVSLFVAATAFGDVGVSLFVAGAAFGKIWVDSRSAKRYIFQYKMHCRGGKSKLCEQTRSVPQFQLHGSFSDHSRIVRQCK